MHTTELDSAVGSTPRSLTPRWDAYHGVFWESWYPWLCGMMYTAELGSAVGCTPQSQTDSKMSVFRVFILATFFDSIFPKNLWSKKLPWTICDLQYQFNFNIFRHHREKAFVIRMQTDTWLVIDWYDAQPRVWIRSGMHTAEFFEKFSSLDSAVCSTLLSLTPRYDAHRRAF